MRETRSSQPEPEEQPEGSAESQEGPDCLEGGPESRGALAEEVVDRDSEAAEGIVRGPERLTSPGPGERKLIRKKAMASKSLASKPGFTKPGRSRNGELKQAILREARRLLKDCGYGELSMRRIAAGIGVTPTSIYLYFDNKDALFHALIDEGVGMLREAMSVALEDTGEGRSAAQRLEAVCRAYLDFGLTHPTYYELMFLLPPMHMQRYPAAMYRRARQNLEIFAEAIADLEQSRSNTAVSQKSEAGSAATAKSTSESTPDPSKEPTKGSLQAASQAWASLHGALSLLLAARLDTRVDRNVFLDAIVRQTVEFFTPSALQREQQRRA